jgi:hypothetical protein
MFGQNFRSLYIIFVHLYMISFGILTISIELEWQMSVHYFLFLESWIGRGLFLLFNGILYISNMMKLKSLISQQRDGTK